MMKSPNNHQVRLKKNKKNMQTSLEQPCKHRLNLHAVVKLKVGVASVPAT